MLGARYPLARGLSNRRSLPQLGPENKMGVREAGLGVLCWVSDWDKEDGSLLARSFLLQSREPPPHPPPSVCPLRRARANAQGWLVSLAFLSSPGPSFLPGY